jgi:hypothetical protein
MSDQKKSEVKSGERMERRPYEAPTIVDFFQPLVVLGTNAITGAQCANAHPKPPKQ